MKRLTLSNFSGGQNEVLYPREFSPNQWHHLVGMVVTEDGLPRSQYPVQRVGNFPSNDHFYKLHSIVTSVGTFLLAITRLGRLYWCKAPAADATYTTANAVTWTQLTQAENYTYTASGNASKETIVDNPYMRFICDLPVQASNYTKVPLSEATPGDGRPQDLSNDTYATNELGEFPGVLISYRINDNALVANPQVLVAYVNTKIANPVVKVIAFPHQRRIPTFETRFMGGVRQQHFINAVFLTKADGANTYKYADDLDYDKMPTWPFNMPATASQVKMHPYAYTDGDGANLSGRGIIPRCNVGCSIQGKVILGDIEWRQNDKALPVVPSSLVSIGLATSTPAYLSIPETLRTDGLVIQNEGPARVYLNDGDGGGADLPSAIGTAVVVRKGSKTNSPANTCILTLQDTPPASADRIVVDGVGKNFDGTFTSFTINTGAKTVSYVNTAGPATIAVKTRKGKVTFQNTVAPPTPEGYKIEIEPKGYAAIPPTWERITAATSGEGEAALWGRRDWLLARHFLNDDNTGPVRNGVYFSDGAIDEFSPVAEFPISRGGAPIAGMESLDGRVLALTEGGGPADGLYRIRGNLTLQLVEDPTAIAIELIKGGVGAPAMPENLKNPPRRTCVWADTSTVVFVDRQGGVYFTDGNQCDRIDRLGPVTIRNVQYASVAAVGRHLFMVRGNNSEGLNKLYCFSVNESDGSSASGIWTQLSLSTNFRINSAVAPIPAVPVPNPPAGHPTYFVGSVVSPTDNYTYTLYSDISLTPFQLTAGKDDLYFIGVRDADGQANEPDTFKLGSTGAAGGNVYRLATAGPVAEYGKLDNVNVVQYVTTPTIAPEEPFTSVKYENLSVEFTTHSSARIVTIIEAQHGGGAFMPQQIGQRFLSKFNTFFKNSVFYDFYPAGNHLAVGNAETFNVARLYEIKTKLISGPSRLISFTMFFDGDMTLHSMSLWSTGERSASILGTTEVGPSSGTVTL